MTITSTIRWRPAVFFCLLVLAVVGVELLVIRRPEFTGRPLLPAAVSADVLLGLPLLYYWLVVRPYQLPATSVVGAFVAAVALATWLIPVPQQQYVHLASRALAGVEVFALAMALVNLRRLRQAYLAARLTDIDVVANLTTAFRSVFGRVMGVFVSEISLFYYALLSWRARPEVDAPDTVFTSYRESAFTATMATVGLLSVAEMGAAHVLLVRWSPTAAWIGLALHLYGLMLLLAHSRAVRLRPIRFTENQELVLRTGFFWLVRLPASAITACQPLIDAPKPAVGLLNLAGPLLTPPNVLLTLEQPFLAAGPYGISRPVRQLALYVDQPAAFRQALALA
ncbi:hypothetical protein GCM10027346_34730 [Hymenobacter seoulensis]